MKRPRKPRKPGSSFGGRTTRMHAPDFGELEFDSNGYAYPDMGAFAVQPLHKRNLMLARTVPVTLAYDALRLNIEREETMRTARQLMNMNGERIVQELAARKAAEEAAGGQPAAGPVAVPDAESEGELDGELHNLIDSEGPSKPEPLRDPGFFRRLGRRLFGEIHMTHEGYGDLVPTDDEVQDFGEKFEALGEPPIEPIDGGRSLTVPVDENPQDTNAGGQVDAKPVWLEKIGPGLFIGHNHVGFVTGCHCPTMGAPHAEN